MDLLEDLKMPLINSNFVMIKIIHKMLVLLKHHLNYLISSDFLRSIIDFYSFSKNFFFFFTICNDEKFSLDEENITKDITNLYKLKKKS